MKKHILVILSAVLLILCSACANTTSSIVSSSQINTPTLTPTPTSTATPIITQTDPLASVTVSGLMFLSNPASDVSSINQGQQSGNAYVLVNNPTDNYSQISFTLKQYDSDGNFIQQSNSGTPMGQYIPPLSYWALLTQISSITQSQLKLYKISNVSKTVIPANSALDMPTGTYQPSYLTNFSFTNLSIQTNSSGDIALSGSLFNNNPPLMPTPKYVLAQVFIDNAGKGDYSLIGEGYLQNGGELYGITHKYRRYPTSPRKRPV